MADSPAPSWWARGLIFENCGCTLVCPGHMHFSQFCTHERCKGYWALRFDEGAFGGVPLAGTRAVVAFDCPQRMVDGQWIQSLIIDEGASPDQRHALHTILTGRAGGPWAKLATFVGTQHAPEFLRIEIADEGAVKRLTIADRITAIISQIRGRDRARPVVFENCFNQIHAPTQVLALGDTAYGDAAITFHNTGSHGLFSQFDWAAAPAGA